MKIKLLSATIASVALSGCGTYPISTFQPFETTDLNPLVKSNLLVQKVDTFFIVNDSSSSMSDVYEGAGFPGQSEPTKFSVERELLKRLNKSIPDITLSSGIRTFGYGPCLSWGFSKLNQPVQSYSTNSFQKSLGTMECSSGGTPINSALTSANADLTSASGNIALILLSDGHHYDGPSAPSIEALKEKYGDRLCVSTIWVGNESDADGKAILQDITDISGCGVASTVTELATTKGMADFVTNVFFDTGTPNNDGDEDGDGVPDSRDKCPGTPKGAQVDRDGCWTFRGVFFDFDRSNIKSSGRHILENSISVLKQNPKMKVELQGHTDSTGPKAYNQRLSERRANSVKKHFIKNGVSSSRLSTTGFGETQPTTSNKTKEGRAHNRRVVLNPIK
ncbi:MAG: OmpA family protein [Methylococcales bacterium]|nr:OmpA family protein [Methylococcales bacterium]